MHITFIYGLIFFPIEIILWLLMRSHWLSSSFWISNASIKVTSFSSSYRYWPALSWPRRLRLRCDRQVLPPLQVTCPALAPLWRVLQPATGQDHRWTWSASAIRCALRLQSARTSAWSRWGPAHRTCCRSLKRHLMPLWEFRLVWKVKQTCRVAYGFLMCCRRTKQSSEKKSKIRSFLKEAYFVMVR